MTVQITTARRLAITLVFFATLNLAGFGTLVFQQVDRTYAPVSRNNASGPETALAASSFGWMILASGAAVLLVASLIAMPLARRITPPVPGPRAGAPALQRQPQQGADHAGENEDEAGDRSDQRVRLIADNIEALIAYVDRDERYRFVNATYATWFSMAPETAVGRHISDVIGAVAYDAIKEHVKKAISGQKVAYETTLPTKNVGDRDLQVSYIPDISPDGTVLGYFGLAVDITERRQAERELHETEMRLQTIIEHAPVNVVIKDGEGKFVFVGPGSEALYGASREQILGKTSRALTTEELANQYEAADRAVLESGEPLEVEQDIETAGKVHSILTVKFPIPDGHGDNMGIGAITLDVTARKQAEAALRTANSELERRVKERTEELQTLNDALQAEISEREIAEAARRESREQLAAITENLPGGVYRRILHVDGTVTYPHFGVGYRTVFDMDNERAVTDTDYIFSSLHPDDRAAAEAAVKHSGETLTNFDNECRLTGEDGSVKWSRSIAKPHRLANGDVVWDGIAIDINEQKKAQEALQKSEAMLRLVTDAVPALIMYIDRDERYRFANQPLAVWHDLPKDEIIGRTVAEIVGERYASIEDYIKRAYAGETVRYETTTAGDGHDERTVGVVYVPHVDTDGSVLGYVVLAEDITERKRAEAASRESNAQLASIAGNLPGGMYQRVLSADGTLAVTYMSDGFQRVFGIDPAGIEQAHGLATNTAHPDDQPAISAAIQASAENLSAYDNEQRLIAADGSMTWCRSIAQPHRRGNGDIVWDGIAIDITEQKRAEEALRDSEQRFSSITANLPGGVFRRVLRGNGRLDYTYVGEGYRRIFDVDPGKVEQSDGLSTNITHPDDRAAMSDAMKASAADLTRYDQEVRIVGNDGSERWGRAVAQPRRLENGDVIWDGITLDVTEQKRAEIAQRESEERLNAFFTEAPAGLAIYDTDVNYLRVSDTFAKMNGRKAGEHIGKSLYDMLPEDVARNVEANYRAVLATGKPEINGEHSGAPLTRPGDQRDWVYSHFPIRDPSGAIGALGCIVLDITERKRAEKALAELNVNLERRVEERTQALRTAQEELVRNERLAALGQLTGTVSHELRNPLGAMRTSAAVVKQLAPDDNPMLGKAVAIVERSITRCDDIISDLLEYSRVRELSREPVAIDDWVAEVLEEYNLPPTVTLNRELNSGVQVTVDDGRLHRVVINLLQNACQAMTADNDQTGDSPKRQLTVTTRENDDRVEIAVADTGPGMPQETLDKIFEPLFSTKAFGVGLGLTIVRQIMEQHGGGVGIASTDGVGTEVVLWLPRESAAQA